MFGYVASLVTEAAAEFWLLVRPGGISYELHWESFMTSNSHYILEGSLVGIIVYLLLQKGKPIAKQEPLTEQARAVCPSVDLMACLMFWRHIRKGILHAETNQRAVC